MTPEQKEKLYHFPKEILKLYGNSPLIRAHCNRYALGITTKDVAYIKIIEGFVSITSDLVNKISDFEYREETKAESEERCP